MATLARPAVYLPLVFAVSYLVLLFLTRPERAVQHAQSAPAVATIAENNLLVRKVSTFPAAQALEAAAPLPVHTLSDDEVNALVQAAQSAEESEERGEAIRQLSQVTGAAAVETLKQALRWDTDVRNRILAVNSLLEMADRGPETETIRAVLQEAAADRNANVARHARESLASMSSERLQARDPH